FFYFTDHNPELAKLVREGRAKFIEQFPSVGAPDGMSPPTDPNDALTFVRCKLDWRERAMNTAHLALYRDLLKLRRSDPVLASPRRGGIDGAVIGSHTLVLRYFGSNGDDRLLVVNLGARVHADPLAEPLMAPPPAGPDPRERLEWRMVLSTESCA